METHPGPLGGVDALEIYKYDKLRILPRHAPLLVRAGAVVRRRVLVVQLRKEGVCLLRRDARDPDVHEARRAGAKVGIRGAAGDDVAVRRDY